MIRPMRLLLALSLGVLWGRSVADEATGKSAFNWGGLILDSTKVKQCENYGVYLMPPQGRTPDYGTPPYYMFEYKADGVPIVSNIGNDRNYLTWTVKQASGSSVFLTIIDSKGKQGGVAQQVYKINGGKPGCAPKPPSTKITLEANVSTSKPLYTCEPLGLRVRGGGQKPYTISLVAIDSTVVTNVTLGPNDDVLTWPSLAVPNKSFIASVSDASGTWGKSTGIFKTAGCPVTDKTKCSIAASSGNSRNVDQHPKKPWSPKDEKCLA